MVELHASASRPALRAGRGEDVAPDESFDYVLLPTFVPYVDDPRALPVNVAEHATPETRVVVHSYSQLWRPALAVLEWLGPKQRTPISKLDDDRRRQEPDAADRLEPVTTTRRILFPAEDPGRLGVFWNGIVGPLPIVRHRH
jgi:hypothetical protein